MWESLTRDELSCLLYLMAKLVDDNRTYELVCDVSIMTPAVSDYAGLLNIDNERALSILKTYGNFFMEMVDAKIRMNHKKLIGSLTGELPFANGKPL